MENCEIPVKRQEHRAQLRFYQQESTKSQKKKKKVNREIFAHGIMELEFERPVRGLYRMGQRNLWLSSFPPSYFGFAKQKLSHGIEEKQ